jgi:hypothetical protein
VAFRQVLTTFPGYTALAAQPPGVTVIDQRPPSTQIGAGTGTVCLVGEFDNGELETPTEVFGEVDRVTQFGGLGYTIAEGQYRGASAQQSGGNEPWNGNGWVWLANKPSPPRLILVRVDTSAGEVEFTRLASLVGGNETVALDDGDTAVFLLNGVTLATATFNGAVATLSGTGATYASLGGLTLELQYDTGDAFVVTFQSTDVAIADVVARINGQAAADIAFDDSGEVGLQSIIEGADGFVSVVGGTALVPLGLPAAATQDLWTFTVTADTIAAQVRVSRFVDGVEIDYDTASVPATPGDIPAKRLAILAALNALGVPGATFALGGGATITLTGDDNIIFTGVSALVGGAELTIVNTTPGIVTEAYGTGNVSNLASIPVAEQVLVIDAVANISAEVDADGYLRVSNTLTPGLGTIQGSSGNALTVLGFDTTTEVDAADSENLTIPAGTRVQDATSTATIWVTMVDTETGTGGGPVSVKVRPFYDTDTAIASVAGDVTTILDQLPTGFVVDNAAAITRLTPAELDTQYVAAIAKTLAETDLTAAINTIASARSSAAINLALRLNVIEATVAGLACRRTVLRPRLGVTRASAYASVAINRSDRVQFAFPGVSTVIAEIAIAGAAAGVGFSADGRVDVGLDSYAVIAESILPPEQQISQKLGETDVGAMSFISLEETYDPKRGGIALVKGDYTAFIARGILAPRMDRVNGPSFVKDVTSVDPIADPELVGGSRRRMADFIIDSAADVGSPFSGKMNSPLQRQTLLGRQNSFLEILQSPNSPENQRIVSYSVVEVTTPALREQGFMETVIAAKTFAFMDQILIRATVGPSVSTATEISSAA